LVAAAPATLAQTGTPPTLRTQDYLEAIRQKPQPYYLGSTLDGSTPYLLVLNVIRNGTRPIGVAQLAIPTDDVDRTLRLDREVALAGSVMVLLLAVLLSPLIVRRALEPLELMSSSAGALAAGDYQQRVPVPSSSGRDRHPGAGLQQDGGRSRTGLRTPRAARKSGCGSLSGTPPTNSGRR